MATSFKQVADNAVSTTTTPLTSTGVTSIGVATGQGSRFPSPGNGFIVTLWNGNDPGSDPNMEKVFVSARSTDTLTTAPTQKPHTSPCNVALLDVAQNTTDLQNAINSLETTVGTINPSNFVPTTRQVNSKPLSSDITIGEADIPNLIADLAAKAPLASPSLTGIPTVPTASSGTNTTQAASTAFVGSALTAYTPSVATFTTNGTVKQTVYNVRDYGAVADALTLTTGSMTAGSAVLTVSGGSFTSADVGKIITVSEAGTSTRFTGVNGPTMTGSIASYQSANQVTLNISATSTVSAATVNYGTNNASFFTNAYVAAGLAGGGTMLIPSGKYMIGSAVAMNYSNVAVKGSGIGITTIILAYDGSSGAANSNDGAFGVGLAGSANGISNVSFSDFSMNMNGFPGNGIHWHGATTGTAVGRNFVVDGIEMYGRAPDLTGSTACIKVTADYGSVTGLARGFKVKNSIFRDAIPTKTGYTTGYTILINSGSLNEVRFVNNRFYNLFSSTIATNTNSNPIPRQRRDWVLDGNYFYNTVGTQAANYFNQGLGDFVDNARQGFNGIKIINNHFESLAGSWTLDANNNAANYYNLTVYQSNEFIVSHNTFRNGCFVLAPGYDTGDNTYTSSNQHTYGYLFSNNIVMNTNGLLDSDGHIGGKYSDNVFWGIKRGTILGGYAIHYPSSYDGNVFVNCGHYCQTNGSQTDFSLFGIEDGGNLVINNLIYNDPIFTAPVAPTVAVNAAAGNLNGTYLYKVTFISGSGNQSTGGTTTTSVTVTNQQVNLTAIPTGPLGTEGRMIYRTAAGGTDGTQKFVARVNGNNQTTYTDNVADSSLGVAVPTTNATASNLKYIFGEYYGGIHSDFANVYKNNHVMGQAPGVATFGLDDQFKHHIMDNTGITETVLQNMLHTGVANVSALASTDIVFANYQTNGSPVTNLTVFGGAVKVGGKITNLSNGTAASDAVTFGQIPTSLPPSGTAGGDLTGTYPNPTIANNAGTNAKAAQMPANTFKANNTGSTANQTDITISQAKSLLAITESDVINLTTDLAAKAPTASPALTGIPTAPTASANNNSNQLATTAYVDNAASAAAQGLSVKLSVLALGSSNVTLSGTQTIDGLALTAGQRVLLVGQSSSIQNGIWVVQTGAWTRSSDFASGSNQIGSFVFVEGGTVNSSSGWVMSNTASVTVDTTGQNWTQFSGAGEIIAGSGLTKSGNTLALTVPVTSALGGTGTTTAFTAGSIIFASTGGAYSQSNSQLFWDSTNSRLGIGNTAPAYPLDITGDTRVTGNFRMNNGGAITIKDTGGVFRNVLSLDGSNNLQAGHNATTGNAYYGTSSGTNTGSNLYFQIAGSNIFQANSTGLGIGNGPTASLDIKPSVAAAASLRIRLGVAPTSPNSGDIWFDGTNFNHYNGTTTQTFVDQQTAQTIAGAKTFSGGLTSTVAFAFFQSFRSLPQTVTGNTTLNTNSPMITRVNSTSAVTITLPSTTLAGYQFTIKNINTGTVTINGTFDGSSTYNLATQYKYVTVVSTTTAGVWDIVGNN